VVLGVQDSKLGGEIQSRFKEVKVEAGAKVAEVVRGIRAHFEKFVDALREGDLEKAQLGLAHSYSRSKVKFNVHKSDNMVIQAIALLDQLDKDVNTFAMRVREWYSWHFPELYKIVPDNVAYSRLVSVIRSKSSLLPSNVAKPDPAEDDAQRARIADVVKDPQIARDVVDAARSSMGADIGEIDLINIHLFATRVVKLAEFRANLQVYLHTKMSTVAPNLGALLGDTIGARLIAHAGSLTNLAKYPASTVQILGAEKALFRALKTKGKTPKYGLLFHSTYIGRAKAKNKGRISRYLANKCSIASRVDCFADGSEGVDVFGVKLREQMEERLRFYESGATPRKNIDVMVEAGKLAEVRERELGGEEEEVEVKTPKKDKKDKKKGEEKTPKAKSEKKSKKRGAEDEGEKSAKKAKSTEKKKKSKA